MSAIFFDQLEVANNDVRSLLNFKIQEMKVQCSNLIEERDKTIKKLQNRLASIKHQEVDHSKCLQ